jgi:pyruvate ferredoxin oxidoreductase gamma subunit
LFFWKRNKNKEERVAILPRTDEYGHFEIRFESIGGLGANLAGKMLAEAGLKYLGLNVSSFASYGSEKKGSPVKAFVRFADKDTPIKVNSPVERPHCMVVFHENLIKSMPVTLGCDENTVFIVNSRKSPEELQDLLKVPKGRIGSVDATGIALEEKVKINGVILGAIAKAIGFIKEDHVIGVFEEVIGEKYPELVKANVKAIKRGYDELNISDVSENSEYSFKPYIKTDPAMGYVNQPEGGLVLNPGSSVNKDLSAGRGGVIPVFHADKCINCGLCDVVCPDLCMVFKEENGQMFMKGVDYQYCKGCIKCVVICPTKALTEEVEAEYNVDEMTQKLFTKEDMVQNQ